MIEGTYDWQPNRIPTYGKDHLVLADWRLSTPQRKWKQGSQGSETGVFEYAFERPGNKTQIVTMESGAHTPFPALNDDQFLIGLITLSEMAGCPEVLRFEPSHLLKIIRRADCQNNINRAREALKRYKAMSAHFEGLWFDRKSTMGDLGFSSGIIADFGFETGRGRRKKGVKRASYVQWTKSFYESMKNGNLMNISLDDLATCSARTGAMQLFRMTNKAWHGGRKPSVYEREVKELACGHLRMKNDKWTKRNFQNIVQWMEKTHFIKPAAKEARYIKIAQGIWRVRLEIHPSRIVEKGSRGNGPCSTKSLNSKGNSQQPTGLEEPSHFEPGCKSLVSAYMKARFNRTDYRPSRKDTERAKSLLKRASLESLLQVTPRVVQTVRNKNADDLYFGFAEPYYLKAIETSKTSARQNARQEEERESIDHDLARLNRQGTAKRTQYLAKLQTWKAATPEEQADYVQAALDEATTSTAKETILSASLETPPAAVLRHISPTLV